MIPLFKNLKVIELASVLAGPSVGAFFVEMGATVIKIENKFTKGDVTRKWRLPKEDANAPVSAYYCSVNWNKQSLFLDLKAPDDLQELYNLVKTADVVVANFKFGDAEKLKVSYEHLKAIRPNLIYGEINAFGKDSPRTAFDVVLQAESGFMYMNGEPNRLPVKMPVALIDLLTAHQLKEGLLVALLKRQATGEGSYVSVSLMEAALASLVNQATNWLMAAHIPQAMGTLHPNIAPYGEMFQTADQKYLVLAVGNNKQFGGLCAVLQHPEWASDDRFRDNVSRVNNRETLQALIIPIIAQYDRLALMEALTAQKVPAGAIRNMQEVFELPIAQNMIVNTIEEGQATKRLKTTVFQFHA